MWRRPFEHFSTSSLDYLYLLTGENRDACVDCRWATFQRRIETPALGSTWRAELLSIASRVHVFGFQSLLVSVSLAFNRFSCPCLFMVLRWGRRGGIGTETVWRDAANGRCTDPRSHTSSYWCFTPNHETRRAAGKSCEFSHDRYSISRRQVMSHHET